MKQLDGASGFQLPMGQVTQPYLLPSMTAEALQEQQQNHNILAHHQEHNRSDVFKKASQGLNVSTNVHLENLEFGGLVGNHAHRLPPQTVSQTPRLKASTYKSPILDPAEIQQKRANSLLDQDLAFMSASGLADQDDLP